MSNVQLQHLELLDTLFGSVQYFICNTWFQKACNGNMPHPFFKALEHRCIEAVGTQTGTLLPPSQQGVTTLTHAMRSLFNLLAKLFEVIFKLVLSIFFKIELTVFGIFWCKQLLFQTKQINIVSGWHNWHIGLNQNQCSCWEVLPQIVSIVSPRDHHGQHYGRLQVYLSDVTIIPDHFELALYLPYM